MQGFAIYEYLNKPQVTAAWFAINEQMRVQLNNIENFVGIYTLVQWWDAWLADFSDHINTTGQQWAMEALQVSLLVLQQHNQAAVAAGRPTSQHTAMVLQQLGYFASDIKNMVLPVLPGLPQLPAPGSGSKRDLSFDDYGGMEDAHLITLEVDEELWERSMREVDVQIDGHGEANMRRSSHAVDHAHGHGHSHHGHGHAHGHYR